MLLTYRIARWSLSQTPFARHDERHLSWRYDACVAGMLSSGLGSGQNCYMGEGPPKSRQTSHILSYRAIKVQDIDGGRQIRQAICGDAL